jgi:hypothetical protein
MQHISPVVHGRDVLSPTLLLELLERLQPPRLDFVVVEKLPLCRRHDLHRRYHCCR